MVNVPVFGGNVLGAKTAAAGTAFAHVVPPPRTTKRGYTRISQFVYTTGNTAHNVTVMRPIGSTTLSANSNVNTNTLTLTADPGVSASNNIAANDYVAVDHTDGSVGLYTVSAWNGTSKVLTINGNLTGAVNTSSTLWDFGISSDTDPTTGIAHPAFTVANTNTRLQFKFDGAGVKSHDTRSPIVLYSPNTTGAGTLEAVEYAYSVL